jgi:hypothetical protein
VGGTFNAGAHNALYKLNSIEGAFTLDNGQTTSVTPGSGSLTVAQGGTFSLSNGATPTVLQVTGNLDNAGSFTDGGGAALTATGGVTNTGSLYESGGSTLNVAGGFANKAGAGFSVGDGTGSDVANLGSLTNNGTLSIANGATLNLTNQANGITAVVAGSSLSVGGTLNAGTNDGLYKLKSVAGDLTLQNGATTTITPGTGTLTVASGAQLYVYTGVSAGTTLTVNGNLNNSGSLYASYGGDYGFNNNLNVSGALSNQSSGTLVIGLYAGYGASSDIVNAGSLSNSGSMVIGAYNVEDSDIVNTGTLTNTGDLSVYGGDKLNLTASGKNTNSSSISLDGATLEISGTNVSLAGAGTVTLSPDHADSAAITGNGAGIVFTNASTIEGAGTISNLKLVNTGTILANQATPLIILPSAGGLDNKGTLSVLTGDTMRIGTSSGGALTNYANQTLTGGTYTVGGTLQFGASGASIVTDAANISLTGAGAQIVNFGGHNVLANLANITSAGSFTLGASFGTFTTTGGNFTNAGLFTVSAGSTFTVGGSSFNFTQTGGATTVDGTLAGAAAGSLDLNGGALYGTGTVDYGVVDAATITPGDSATKTGKLQVVGTYAQNAGGALNVTVGGLTAGTQFDQLNVTSTASLNGTLNISLAQGYTPAVGNTYDILNATSISGGFSTITGMAINSSEHFTVTTVNGDEIVLTVVSGAATASSVSLTQVVRAGVVHGRYGRQVYTGRRQLAIVAAPAIAQRMPQISLAPVGHPPMGARGFRPMDELGSAALAPAPASLSDVSGAAGSLGIAPVSAAAYNSMSAMSHMRFECGVDLKALLKTSRKQLLKGLWAAPDSPDALDIGYMTYTGSH